MDPDINDYFISWKGEPRHLYNTKCRLSVEGKDSKSKTAFFVLSNLWKFLLLWSLAENMCFISTPFFHSPKLQLQMSKYKRP